MCCFGKRGGVKGQSSIEFLSVVSISLLILIPVIVIFSSYVKTTNDGVMLQQIETVGSIIMSNAEDMYISGKGSWVIVEASLPSAINKIRISGNQDLVFESYLLSGESESVFFARTFEITNGEDCSDECFVDGVHSGVNRFRIYYNDTGRINVYLIE